MPTTDYDKPSALEYMTKKHFWMCEGDKFVPCTYGQGAVHASCAYSAAELASIHLELPGTLTAIGTLSARAITGHHIVAILNMWRGDYFSLPAQAFTHDCDEQTVLAHEFREVALTSDGNVLVSFEQYYLQDNNTHQFPEFGITDDAVVSKDWLNQNLPNWEAALHAGLALEMSAHTIMQGILKGYQPKSAESISLPAAFDQP